MDVHIIVKLKSSFEAWHQLFVNDADRRSQICDENRTLVGKANEKTAVVITDPIISGSMLHIMTVRVNYRDYI